MLFTLPLTVVMVIENNTLVEVYAETQQRNVFERQLFMANIVSMVASGILLGIETAFNRGIKKVEEVEMEGGESADEADAN